MNLEQTNKVIKAFEKEIKRLLKLGKSPKEAVRAAYKKFPVMETLREELDAQIIAEMARGSEYAFPAEALAAAAAKPWAEDGLTLSDRTTKGSKAVVSHVAAAIGNCIKENQTTYATSRKLFDGYQKDGIIPEQDIPNFMHSLIRAAQPDMRRSPEFRRVLRNATRNVGKLTTQGMKAAYNQITEAILTGNEKRLDKAVYVATQERTRYFAERIARTELARAYHDGVAAKWGDDPDCVAYKWRMSKSHPAPDICDMYAGANLYGMGPGVFPKDKVPELPAHPHCMCYLRPLMDGSLRLESNTPVDRVAKGGKEWLDKQSLMTRQAILGVMGEAQYQKGGNWQVFARGYGGRYLKTRIDMESEHGITNKQSKGDPLHKVNWDKVNSPDYKAKFLSLNNPPEVNEKLYSLAVKMLRHREGTQYEDLYAIDHMSGREIVRLTQNKTPFEVEYTERAKQDIAKHPNQLISIHSHPNDLPPTGADIYSQHVHLYRSGYVVTFDGALYEYKLHKSDQVSLSTLQVFDFRVENKKKRGYNINERDAIIQVLSSLQKQGIIAFREVK
nr:MAG TPA: minor capsid protein [Caudoviricetes sp.]